MLIAGARNAGGDLTITWVRRTRFGGVWADGVDVPLNEESERYEVDVSYAHRDGNDPNWTELVEGEAHVAHTCDIDHVRLRAARYLRIRNLSNERVDIDAVFVRRFQPCSDPVACRNVQHGG